jgi:hypothetical protein
MPLAAMDHSLPAAEQSFRHEPPMTEGDTMQPARTRSRETAFHGALHQEGRKMVVRRDLSPRGRLTCVKASVVAIALLISVNQRAAALIVESTPGTTTAPADDPGWNFVTSQGRQFVYLGDGWALSAFHVGLPNISESLHFPGGPFNIIKDQSFIVPNPAGSNLTADTDLRLIRINGDLGTPSFSLAAQPIFESSTPLAQREVVIIGHGPSRQSYQAHWDVQIKPNDHDDIWTEVFPPEEIGTYQGYKSVNPDDDLKRWGKNQIADEDSLFGGNDNDLRGTLQLQLGVGQRDIMSMVTKFDAPGQGGLAQEVQAVGGDSGSAVFYKRGGHWELIGIVNAQHSDYENQSSSHAVYGNYTTFADLSYYRNEIMNIINENPNYSVMGDINLDGAVSGNGTGPAASDDISAFIQGWNHQQSTANIASWQKGDMNLDGRTDVSDFVLFRNTLNGTASGAALTRLMGGVAVPEPAAAVLLLVGALLVLNRRRRSV